MTRWPHRRPRSAPPTRARRELGAADPALLALEVLDERERTILDLHLRGGETYAAIAASLGISEQRVWQLAHRAVARLRAARERSGALSPEASPFP